MGETNNIYPNLTSNLSSDQQFRLTKINEIRDQLGIISASFSIAFSISTGIVKKILKTTRNKKKNIIKLLCLQKAN